MLYSKYFPKLISNFVAPYNLVHTNVLEELTIPVSGAEDHNQNCRRCENFSIIFTLLNSRLQCEIWRSILRNFFQPSITLLLSVSSIIHVYVVYLTWKWRMEAGTRRFPYDDLITLKCWLQLQLPSLRPFPVFHSRTCLLPENHTNFLLEYDTPIYTLKVLMNKLIRKSEFLR